MSTVIAVFLAGLAASPQEEAFEGKFFSGRGDVEYIELLDIAGRMFAPDPEFQNLLMLYKPEWNGFVEGPTWNAWWIQNSYGPTFCALPFWQEPYTTWIQNSQDLWFDQMGDGKRKGYKDWVGPDGALCDAASPEKVIYKQGDGKTDIHDWGMEFTAAGVVLQAELLLIQRDKDAIKKYLPKLERSANFIESRRDPKNNLFLVGPAGNLLAPSYAGWRKPDGTYDKAYLAGLSITYIAALDRLIELEKMVGRSEQAALYRERRDLARVGLAALTTDEGYFVKSIDPDGTRHGVYGADKHGYFEAVCNHDAICFRVVDDAQAHKIYDKIASIPGLRQYDLIITNYPSLDDTYEQLKGIWQFGHWVNGGHWSTCEARMIMGYYRLGKYEDARRSMKRILGFARQFRMDNNLTNFGSEVYQPHQPINCVYDAWGVPAAMIRSLFEYLYTADGLKILPHIPPGITQLKQSFPIRFGQRRIFLDVVGSGPVRSALVNGQPLDVADDGSLTLADDESTPNVVRITFFRGETKPTSGPRAGSDIEPLSLGNLRLFNEVCEGHPATTQPHSIMRLERISAFYDILQDRALADCYEARHAHLVLECAAIVVQRRQLQEEGKIKPLASHESQTAAEKSYIDTVHKLAEGLESTLNGYGREGDLHKQRMYHMWIAAERR